MKKNFHHVAHATAGLKPEHGAKPSWPPQFNHVPTLPVPSPTLMHVCYVLTEKDSEAN